MGRKSCLQIFYDGEDTKLEQKIQEELEEDMTHTRKNIISSAATVLSGHKEVEDAYIDTGDRPAGGFREKELAIIDKVFEDTIAELAKRQSRGRFYHLRKLVTG